LEEIAVIVVGALGSTGRARRIDDAGDIVRSGSRNWLSAFGVADHLDIHDWQPLRKDGAHPACEITRGDHGRRTGLLRYQPISLSRTAGIERDEAAPGRKHS